MNFEGAKLFSLNFGKYFDSLNIQNTMNLEAETVEEFPRLHDQPTDKDDGETSWGDPGTRRFGWEGVVGSITLEVGRSCLRKQGIHEL